MRILGYSWAGVPTQNFEQAMDFFEKILQLRLVRNEVEDDFGMFVLPSGQTFEIFGPRSNEKKFMFVPAIAFDVTDVYEARAYLEAQGVQFITKIATSQSGDASWTYFIGLDNFLYEIWQHK